MKKNQGFTLIELMIVIAIIGILAAVVKNGYDKYNGSASIEGHYSVKSVRAMKVEDNPDLSNCKSLPDDNRVIYSCPDGKIYTK